MLVSLMNQRVLRLVETRAEPLPPAEDGADTAQTPEMV